MDSNRPKTSKGTPPTNKADEPLDAWNELGRKELNDWRAKPRLHTAVFEKYLTKDLTTDPPDEAFPSPEVKEAFYRQRRELIDEIEAVRKEMGWDEGRLLEFSQTVVEFRKQPTIAKYLKVRKKFPDLDIQVGMSGGIDPLFAIQEKCEKYKIDPLLVAGAMDGFEPGIDALSLVLMDRIVSRDKIAGPGSAQRRRDAISKTMVDFLISAMIEGIEWSGDAVRLPASLILLIRHQLGALKGDLHQEAQSYETKASLAFTAAQHASSDEIPSINDLLSFVDPEAPISRATIARWRKDKQFNKLFLGFRKSKRADWPESHQNKLVR
ncbi:hypothetical protein [Bradyrhizobium iriomotense]|uniref:hypothetical protein n=1 Tax=Bradyrhizobium iriomotense TaxID=441950 RepID=UPI001B8A2EAA|nr:hypothetical protein [Bradyrhizobium iriomotense]MBR1130663.1 hypothetical protein [Bradyrhizobium iriomotense]